MNLTSESGAVSCWTGRTPFKPDSEIDHNDYGDSRQGNQNYTHDLPALSNTQTSTVSPALLLAFKIAALLCFQDLASAFQLSRDFRQSSKIEFGSHSI